MRITVIGTGYLGATHAAAMAELGHEVLGVDVDPAKIEALSAGQVPFFEPGLPELLKKHVESGRLRFTTDYDEAVEFANVHFVGVGTPQIKGSYAADVRYVDAAVTELAKRVVGKHLVFGKSTVPVGTAPRLQELAAEIISERAASGDEQLKNTSLEIAWNPEFLREGFAVKDTLEPDRVVLGVQKPGMILNGAGQEVESIGEDGLRECFGPIIERETPFIVADTATAELVKVSANAFLATKISFINAVSEICEVTGADITTLADAIGMDARIGRRFLNAGLGFGGGCLPKDIRAFMARAGELGVDQALTFLREVDAINMRRREKTVDLVRGSFGGSLLGHTVTVLGAAFKPNSDDVRDSPALSIAGSLSLAGASVSVYDPQAMENAKKNFPTLEYAPSIEAALEGSEMVVVATEWQQFREIDPVAAKKLVKRAAVLDGRNCLPADKWRAAGWDVTCLGRG
ncbi:UDP-glucose/GDP-mannose dehydrogenase family protein [Corynebacterium amycolatum]|uniref:UDP-glucose dehydrogenase family protein n=1 Tax=Corynebacterium TaxID=1716 RepID=UPI00065FBA7E|nr:MULTISPECIES: UDP-glucose/GDP-mannose dehydrogenase family protein [Corynebacterium]KAA9268631.1 UDP-glucose/GDP-mannose dehydrogenase family protein [Corynebacterium amycolatum]MBU5624318.1 UDP-glucose/GDP-mannose dehydrogenase family protein [Corynebacterium amycolatum]MCG7246075.1 UDP-glucose/GDP-mannose dehydrogenase family protein [Corynebacterium sp. ACRPX]MCT1719483.1 UDP-glucose/GDP-mannose dehydrogenase family protein [Corynebacterium amycolatum]MDK8827327.1 UDP-glucose/GDP-mannose